MEPHAPIQRGLRKNPAQGRAFNLEINIDPVSFTQLKNANAQLCIARVLFATYPFGDVTPTVWLASPDFSRQTKVSWDSEYEAYMIYKLKDQLFSFRTPIRPGQTFEVGAEKSGCTGESVPDSNLFTFSNNSGTEVKAGLCQKIFLEDKDMDTGPISFQTLEDKSEKSLLIVEHIYVSFVPEDILSGHPIMDSSQYPAILVSFDKPQCKREIFYETFNGVAEWSVKGEETWGVLPHTLISPIDYGDCYSKEM